MRISAVAILVLLTSVAGYAQSTPTKVFVTMAPGAPHGYLAYNESEEVPAEGTPCPHQEGLIRNSCKFGQACEVRECSNEKWRETEASKSILRTVEQMRFDAEETEYRRNVLLEAIRTRVLTDAEMKEVLEKFGYHLMFTYEQDTFLSDAEIHRKFIDALELQTAIRRLYRPEVCAANFTPVL